MKVYSLETTRNGLLEITEQVEACIAESGVQEGIAVIMVPHTTAGVTVISRMDVLGFQDVEEEIDRLVPTRINFKHQFDTPTDAAGHIKSALIGASVSVIVAQGTLVLGGAQGIFFFEFDGPRKRKIQIQVAGK